jgi:hypothetical protein
LIAETEHFFETVEQKLKERIKRVYKELERYLITGSFPILGYILIFDKLPVEWILVYALATICWVVALALIFMWNRFNKHNKITRADQQAFAKTMNARFNELSMQNVQLIGDMAALKAENEEIREANQVYKSLVDGLMKKFTRFQTEVDMLDHMVKEAELIKQGLKKQ